MLGFEELKNFVGIHARQILEESPLVSLTHCYEHALNLAVKEMIRAEELLRDAMDTANEHCKLIKSPQNKMQCSLNWKKNMIYSVMPS